MKGYIVDQRVAKNHSKPNHPTPYTMVSQKFNGL